MQLLIVPFSLFFLLSPVLIVLLLVRVERLHRRISRLEANGTDPAPVQAPPTPAPPTPAPPTPAPPPPAPPTPTASPSPRPSPARAAVPEAPGLPRNRSLDDLERILAANWLVWVGGAILALGGLLLVRTALDAGLFGPVGRTLAAAMLGAALLWASLRAASLPWIGRATGSVPWLPHVLACAGVIVLYGASLAAGPLYGLVPPALAFAGFVAVALVAVLFALRFGPVPAALGLVGAYAAPALTGAEGGALALLLAYTTAVTAGALTMVRVLAWRLLVWIPLAGSGLWGLHAVGAALPAEQLVLLAHPVGLALVASVFAHDLARAPLPLGDGADLPRRLERTGEALLAAHGFWVAAGCLFLATWFGVPALRDALPWTSVLLALPALAAAGLREGFSLFPLVPLALGAACLLLREPQGGAIAAPALLALLTAAGGTMLQSRHRVRAPLATVAALAPVLLHGLLFARWQIGGGLPGTALALLVAAGASAMVERERERDPTLTAHPGAAAAYALGAVLALALAPFLGLAKLWIAPALAAVAFAAARVHGRIPLPLLRLGAVAVAGLATALYLAPWRLAEARVSPFPFLNEFAVVFVVGAVLLYASARCLAEHRRAREGLEGAAALVAFGGVGVLVRHAATGGQLDAPAYSLAEAGGYAIAYLGAAAGIVLRNGGRPWLFHVPLIAANGLGLAAVLSVFARLDEPVRGYGPLDLLLPALAMPAILLLVQARGWRPVRPVLGDAFDLLGKGLAFAWLVLEVHRAFVGPDLTRPITGELELWCYSATGIAFAGVLLGLGLLRGNALDRRASLVLLLLGVGKVFLVDLEFLTGVLRAGSFLAMGAVLIGVALLYQRFVFRGTDEAPSPAPDGAGP